MHTGAAPAGWVIVGVIVDAGWVLGVRNGRIKQQRQVWPSENTSNLSDTLLSNQVVVEVAGAHVWVYVRAGLGAALLSP